MPAAAWTIRCARRPREVTLQARVSPNTTRRQIMNGTGYWTRTADISKTGMKCIRGGQDTVFLHRRVGPGGTAGTARPATGISTSCSGLRPVDLGFRPVLEVLNPDTLGSGGTEGRYPRPWRRQAGRQLRGYSNHREKRQRSLPRPASDGLTRPAGDTEQLLHVARTATASSYAPGGSVPAEVTEADGAVD